MITFYTRSRPLVYSTLSTAIVALEQGMVQDEIISASMDELQTWLRPTDENEAEYRVRILKDLRYLLDQQTLDKPILVQECAIYKRTYTRRISHKALQDLMITAYKLPLDTTFAWIEDSGKSGVTVIANYTLTSSSSSEGKTNEPT